MQALAKLEKVNQTTLLCKRNWLIQEWSWFESYKTCSQRCRLVARNIWTQTECYSQCLTIKVIKWQLARKKTSVSTIWCFLREFRMPLIGRRWSRSSRSKHSHKLLFNNQLLLLQPQKMQTLLCLSSWNIKAHLLKELTKKLIVPRLCRRRSQVEWVLMKKWRMRSPRVPSPKCLSTISKI